MKIQVVIVEDDEKVRKLNASILNFYPDLECIGAFENGEDLDLVLGNMRPAVILVDIDLGPDRKDGIGWVRRWKHKWPSIEFIMFTNYGLTMPDRVFEALKAGATGYLLKNALPEELAEAVRTVVAGGSPMNRDIARKVISYFNDSEKKYRELEKLTPTERSVAEELMKGGTYEEIAKRLFVGLSTIQSHVRKIYEKLALHSRHDLMRQFPNLLDYM